MEMPTLKNLDRKAFIVTVRIFIEVLKIRIASILREQKKNYMALYNIIYVQLRKIRKPFFLIYFCFVCFLVAFLTDFF